MKFTQRLGFYLSGFAIGLIILMFFLNGKDASCDYGPNARTVKNISSKKFVYSGESLDFIRLHALDSNTVKNLIKFGSVDFSKSERELDSCKVYYIENSYKDRNMIIKVQNCNRIATIKFINYVDSE
ncbi:MAG: hypothetical protein HKN40_02220 [Winogradskyella sp.]|uniref:hypothetical protein n=1 Tax=Winogradskyella sp. TaxID=1883156 RepID=UPI0017EA2707|nr:hypothetical protein [Winogradskyella sp.]